MKTSDHISNFLAFTRDLQTEYSINYTDVGTCDDATQDILHQIELGSYKDRNKYTTQLAKIRKRRRKSKDFVDINKTFVEYIKSDEFKKVYKVLEKLLGDVRKQENYVESHRQYNARICDNLSICSKEKVND